MKLVRRMILFAVLISILAIIGGCTMPKKQGGAEGRPPGAKAAKTGEKQTGPQQEIKIGFIVKQPEEPWFQAEWKFAEQAADEYGFQLLKVPAKTAERVLTAIDSVAAKGAQGLIICTPDVHLGPAIVNKCQQHGLKLMSVDDRFLNADEEPMTEVHHLGISAYNIGRLVGRKLHQQMQQRGWDGSETAACGVTYNQLDTIAKRTDGAKEALIEVGFDPNRIFEAPLKNLDVPSALNAVRAFLVRHPKPKKWLVYGGNDSSVLGAIRAMENRGFGADDVIGIGINGTQAVNEFQKDKPTGFYGSILLRPKKHGYETAKMMYKWITEGQQPPMVTRTAGELITRDNYKEKLKEQGLWKLVK